MKLEDLIGLHELSGVDTTTEKVSNYGYYQEEVNVVRFILDGKTYKAIEDPNDGYRSHCEELVVCDEKVSNSFPPQKVVGIKKNDDTHTVNDIIRFIDVISGKIVLEVGTENTDDYYPYCVMNWWPQNLACNIGK